MAHLQATNLTHHHKRHGFTLLELSIVLVIIGLVVGGVLVGRDLITSSEIRATVAQKYSFDTAVNTFKAKYNALPGDMLPTEAAQYGLFQLTGPSCSSFNDGIINGCEHLVFWRHLSEALLIPGKYGSDATNPINPATGSPTIPLSTYQVFHALFFPTSKFRETKDPYFTIGTGSRFDTQGVGYSVPNVYSANFICKPTTAYAFDSKLDDGMPNTGKVFDYSQNYNFWSAAQEAGQCTFDGADEYSAAARYNLMDPGSVTQRCCNMNFGSSF